MGQQTSGSVRKLSLALIFIFLVSPKVLASSGGGTRFRVDGSLSAGSGKLNAIGPGSVTLGTGTYFGLQAEKPFGGSPLYLEATVDYLRSSGTLNYDYQGAVVHYTAPNVNFTMDVFEVTLGVRLKILDSSFFRPYIEGGGAGGYDQLTYDKTLTNAVGSMGNDYKTLEGVLQFGTYAEGGIEVDVTSGVGLRASYRYTDSSTRPAQTIGNQTLHYSNNIFYGSLYTHF